MIANLMALSVRMRWTVLALFLVIGGLGLWQLTKLPIDAVPDITSNQVQINTIDPRLSPVEIEKRSEEHTSELQSLMRNSYAVFCLKKKNKKKQKEHINHHN